MRLTLKIGNVLVKKNISNCFVLPPGSVYGLVAEVSTEFWSRQRFL